MKLFILGLFIAGITGAFVMCCLQIDEEEER